MENTKKIYFASDAHLGFPSYEKSLVREKKFVLWLDEIKNDASEIFLLGDIFDFWYEYKRVVPRGYTRLLGKISEITDSGIPVHFFTGNHDIWVFDYLPTETGVIIHREKFIIERNGKTFLLAHGDGLGPGDKSFKLMKKFFTSPIAQKCFSLIHPNLALKFGLSWSHRRRHFHQYEDFLGQDKEWLVIYSKEKLKTRHYDYFIYGHRHIPMVFDITENSKYINLGDWIGNFTYGVFDGKDFELKKFDS